MKQPPKFILSKKKVFDSVNKLKEIVDEVSYSWKTNIEVGKILNESETCYQSVHSINELEQVANKNKIWYFGFAWDKDYLKILIQTYNQRNFVLDNEEDLNVLLEYIKKTNIKVNILLRMKLRENSLQTGKHYIFGMRVEKVKELLKKLKIDKNVEKIGVHFHRKTQNVSEWSLKEDVADILGEEYLKIIDIMNLGGGLPGRYKNTNDTAEEAIFTKISYLVEYLRSFKIKTFIEPGRFVASGALKLETQIIKVLDNTIFLNCSIFNGSLDTVVANVKLLIDGEKESGTKYTLKGCTPDSTDILRYSVYLENPKVGDIIIFLNCGAYTYQTNFCALDYIETEIVEDF
jgi:ornithine decarboxylase